MNSLKLIILTVCEVLEEQRDEKNSPPTGLHSPPQTRQSKPAFTVKDGSELDATH